ncbi:unnamed protein product [Orchesella dallaii]|uniref:C2H2-type domain-containing protein n=1 Tax=Orchesella dallaii TaxID=48710 RepID=A0ABP1S9S4_9HEXA
MDLYAMSTSESEACYPSESGSEVVEPKISVRVESCLLCAATAVEYDIEGNVIKRETISDSAYEDDVVKKWSSEQLLMFLSQSLGLKNKCKRKSGWGLQLDPFPFCQMCEVLLNSLAHVYWKLEELQDLLKGKMEEAEELFRNHKLYEKHDKAYWEFRKDAIGEKKLSPKTYLSTWKKRKAQAVRPTIKVKRSRTKKKKNDQNSGETSMRLDPDHGLSPGDEDDSKVSLSTRVLRKRGVSQSYYEQDEEWSPELPTVTEEKVEQLIVPEDLDDTPFLSSPAKQVVKVQKKYKKWKPAKGRKVERERNAPPHIPRGIGVECSSALVPVLVSKNKRFRLLRTTKTKSRRNGFLERDPATGNITYTTGFGNRFGTFRTILLFKHIELEGDEEGKMGYQCTSNSCQQTFPLLISSHKQQQLFREHYLASHSDRYKCKLCPQPQQDAPQPQHKNREEFLEHLKKYHGIKTMGAYNTKKWGSGGPLKTTLLPNGCCKTCGMPGLSVEGAKYKAHLLSHMNEEERSEAMVLEGRVYKELVSPTPQQMESGCVNQCQVCGKFITQGVVGLKRHQLDNHENVVTITPAEAAMIKDRQKEPQICSICGVSMYSKKCLEVHTAKFHPDGKWDGPFKCKFPACPHNSSDEPSLKVHIEEEHGESVEAQAGVLCKICGRVLATPWTLKMHGLVHSGEKKHQCTLCSKTFPLKSTLKLHLATKHGLGAQKLTCEEEGCGKFFINRIYFRIHMRKVHGIFVKNWKSKGRQAGVKKD